MKPMLAGKCTDIHSLEYPVLVSPKLDGVRGTIQRGGLLSRSLKPIPNADLQRHFSHQELDWLDGELIAGTPVDSNVYLDTVSGVMTRCTDANRVHLWVFDDMSAPTEPFSIRFARAASRVEALKEKGFRVCLVPHYECYDAEELLKLEALFLSQGYEGAMIRRYGGPYKQGRSTEREGWLLKLKRFEDSEALVLGMEELLHNHNTLTKNALGHAERSSHKANLVAGGCLGALIVKDLVTGVVFNIGSGFTQAQREDLWMVRDELLNTVVKYKYFPTGVKDKPRFPTYIGPRAKADT